MGRHASPRCVLSARPLGPVTVTAAASASGVMALAPGAVSFTPTTWNLEQTITVTGSDDPDITDDHVRLVLVPDLAGVASHDLALIRSMGQRVLVLSQGALVDDIPGCDVGGSRS